MSKTHRRDRRETLEIMKHGAYHLHVTEDTAMLVSYRTAPSLPVHRAAARSLVNKELVVQADKQENGTLVYHLKRD